jgi:hypothetical protein
MTTLDLRPIPLSTRRELLAAVADAHQATRVLLTGLREAVILPEQSDVVDLVAAIVRAGARRTDAAGRAALRPVLVALADARDDLAAVRSPAALDDPDDGEWTPDLV